MPSPLNLVRSSLSDATIQLQNKTLVVGVSGGPDSLALLHILKRLQPHFEYHLWTAHLDHGLRRASKEDALFVQKVSSELGVPFVVERRPVTQRQSKHTSQELRARQVRHTFLREVASRLGAIAVALGHTSDDQAETILLHILRGAGLTGIAGMRTVTSWPEPRIDIPLFLIRPLLSLSHMDTVSYCESAGLKPRQDPSNYDLRYTRNRIRHQLLPTLERYNPQIRQALWRLARAADADIEFLKAEATKHLEQMLQHTSQGVGLPKKTLNALPISMQRHILRLAYAQITGSTDGLSQKHLDAMLRLCSRPGGRHLDLPGNVHIQSNASAIILGVNIFIIPPPLNADLLIPGTTSFGSWEIKADLLQGPLCPPDDPHLAYLDSKAAGKRITVRARQPGDRFQPLGMNYRKKLQDFLVDEKVPQELRDHIPIIEGDGGILWVVGQRIAHWARATPKSQSLLVLKAQLPLNHSN